jgi:dCTP deaminase
LLVDQQIRDLCINMESVDGLDPVLLPPMIEPFSEGVSGGGVVSYGLTSAGYDLRLAPEIWAFKNTSGESMDPKRFHDKDYCSRMFDKVLDIADGEKPWTRDYAFTLPAHSYVLGRCYEYLRIPRYLKAHCVGKSTYARVGIVVNTTPLEPGWEGHLTLEIGNITPCPVRLYVMEGIAQLEFTLLNGEPEKDYGQRGGKYNKQIGVTPARIL